VDAPACVNDSCERCQRWLRTNAAHAGQADLDSLTAYLSSTKMPKRWQRRARDRSFLVRILERAAHGFAASIRETGTDAPRAREPRDDVQLVVVECKESGSMRTERRAPSKLRTGSGDRAALERVDHFLEQLSFSERFLTAADQEHELRRESEPLGMDRVPADVLHQSCMPFS